jgi:ABC-type tungstate transport system substrate-binding protein
MDVMTLVRTYGREVQATARELAALGVGLMLGLDVGASTATVGTAIANPTLQTWGLLGEQVQVSALWLETMTWTLRGLWVVAIVLVGLAVFRLLDQPADEVSGAADGEGEPAQ